MKFSDLTIYFEELEATSSRIELTNILSDLLKKLSHEEIDKVAYLLQGIVVPFYEPIEIGMADKMVDQAIASACNVSRENVQKLSAKLGDMGLVVEQLSGGKKGSKLTISDVHEGLYKIANTSGEGSVGKKINVLAGLLKELDAKKYWSAASAQDALKAVKKVELQVGKPVRPALAERLPDAESVVKRMGEEFAVEPKYDGFRNQVHLDRRQKADSGKQVQIFSRNLENMTHMFPDLVEAVKKEVNAKSTIFEGEAIAFNPVTEEFLPFQETTKRRRKYSVEEFAAKLPLKLFAFDLLYLNGNDITNLSYKERRKKLSQIISSEGQIMVAKEEILHSSQELTKMFEEQIASGLEGVMIKKLDAPYKAGNRGFHWVKFKRMAAGELSDTIDCVLLGIYTGTGKRTGFGVGGLLVGVYNKEKDEFVTVSRIGTGLTDDEFRKVNQIAQKIKVDKKPARVSSLINPSYWVEPKEVLEIFADEITRSPVHTAGKIGDEPGYALRFPRLVSFRGADKRAEDATTVSELINMYKRQRKVKVR